MLVQPYVIRLHFHTEEQAAAAQDKLESIGVFPDFAKTGTKSDPLGQFKMIFTTSEIKEAKSALSRTKLNQGYVDVFDPATSWSEEFVALR